MHMRSFRTCCSLFPASFKLAEIDSFIMLHLLPCFIKSDMLHTWLCIMPCVCGGCLLCCLFLSGLLLLLPSVSFRSCEDSFDYVCLSSSWTRSSSLWDLRQDDHTLEITSIFACQLFALLLCHATYQLLYHASHIAMNL